MYDAALRSAPDDLSLLLSRSMAHSMSTPPRLDLALKDADAVIQLNPEWWQGWLQKGKILLRMGNLQSAEEVLTKAAGFAQGMDRNRAQRALADVRKRRPQPLTTAPPPATEILTPDPIPLPQQSQSHLTEERPSAAQSNLPLRPPQSPSLALPLSSPTSNTVSTTLPTLSPSTPPSTTFYTPSTAPTNLETTAVLPGATTTQSPLYTSPTASSTPASTNQPPQPAWASAPHGSGTSTAQPSVASTFTWPSSTHPPASASSHRPTSKFTILRNH